MSSGKFNEAPWRKRHKPNSGTRGRRRSRQPSHLAFSASSDGSTLHSILQSLLTLYSLLALTLGVVVPISDALAKPVAHADHRQLFYIFMHSVGLIGIVYMNSLISYYGSKASKNHKTGHVDDPLSSPTGVTTVTTVKYFPAITRHSDYTASAETTNDEVERPETLAIEAGEDVIMPDSSITVEDHEQFEDEVERSRSAFHRIVAHLRRGAKQRSEMRRAEREISKQKRRLTAYPEASTVGDQWRILWSAAGVNLYLRFGAIIFGFGVMAHIGFKIVDALRKQGSERCFGPWFLPRHIIDLLFIVVQTYFLFKHHKVTINTQRSLVRFFLIHLAVTNLCIWIKTVIYEIKAGLAGSAVKKLSKSIAVAVNFTSASYGQYINTAKLFNSTDVFALEKLLQPLLVNATAGNTTSAGDTSCYGRQSIDKNSPSVKLGPYLYPCAVEYGLICAAICYKFFTNVGNTEGATPITGLAVPHASGTAGIIPRTTTCHKSHRGLFGGLIVTICVLVPMVSLLIMQQSNSEQKDLHVIAMLVIETLVLACTTVVALVGAAIAVRDLKLFKIEHHEAFDVNLLFVGLAGIVCYSLFVVISVGACMVTPPTDQHAGCQWGGTRQAQINQLSGLKALADLTQSVAQTLFIMQAIQRKITRSLAEKMQKPGRGITAALLISNLAMWIASVFEFQRDVGQDFLDYYFGVMPWSIIQLIFQPLIIFYRFHSTVCLSEIWVHSYKLGHHQLNEHEEPKPRRRKKFSFKSLRASDR